MPPNGEDIAFGAAGGALAGIEKLHSASESGQAEKLRTRIGELSATESQLRGLADSAADPKLKAQFLRQADATARELGRNNIGLRTLNASQKIASNITSPKWIADQLGNPGKKVIDLGTGLAEKTTRLGDRIQNLGPGAGKVGERVANSGINTALAAGKVGSSLEEAGPNAGKLGRRLTSAGISAGNNAIDLGGQLGPAVTKLGQKIGTVGSTIGAKITRAGASRAVGQAVDELAPALAKVGGLVKLAGPAGYFVNAFQAWLDYSHGKSGARVAAETTGSVVGGMIGAAAVGALGSIIPVAGTTAGAVVGNVIGSYIGGKIGDLAANMAGAQDDK